jgi:hypothetical protein
MPISWGQRRIRGAITVVIDLVETGEATMGRKEIYGPMAGFVDRNVEVGFDVSRAEEGEPGRRTRETPAKARRQPGPKGRTNNSSISIPAQCQQLFKTPERRMLTA